MMINLRSTFCLLLVAALPLAWASSAAAAARYRLQPLEATADQTDVFTLGVNDRQQIVGYVLDAGGAQHAVTWTTDGVDALPGLFAGGRSWAFRLNNAGQIVGKAETAEGELHAVMWHHGEIRDLGTLPGGHHSFAADINELGVVAGSSEAAVGQNAFRWTEADGFQAVATADPPLRLTVAGFNGINDSGLAVGTTYYLLEPYHAAFARPIDRLVSDLAPPGRTVGMAMAVNNSDVIVGYQSQPNQAPQAAIFHTDGTFEQIGTLGLDESWAEDVNDRGTIVGRAFSFDGGGRITTRAFVYDKGQMDDLLRIVDDATGWESLIEAASINADGVIVGEGIYRGEVRGFVAVPLPEPSAAFLLALGGSLFGSGRRSRARRGERDLRSAVRS